MNDDGMEDQLHSILSVARLQTSHHQPRISSISCNLDSCRAVTTTINSMITTSGTLCDPTCGTCGMHVPRPLIGRSRVQYR